MRWPACALLTLALGGCVATPPGLPAPDVAVPALAWAPLGAATVRPGVAILDGGCTANFVFVGADNATAYLGTAAHCFHDGSLQDLDCRARSWPEGTRVAVEGALRPAVLAYSSWHHMGNVSQQDRACFYNDFALLRLHPHDVARANPAVLGFGGPTGLDGLWGLERGDKVLVRGAGFVGPKELARHEGYITAPTTDGWTLNAALLAPAALGDSGAPVVTAEGRAIGILVTLNVAPTAGSNGIASLERAVRWANDAGMDVRLATWEPLDSGVLPGTP